MMAMQEAELSLTSGEPKTFASDELEKTVTRMCCENCGTAIGTRSRALPGAVIIKVGTMDDPSVFKSQMAIFTIDSQDFHHIPEGLPAFERTPG